MRKAPVMLAALLALTLVAGAADEKNLLKATNVPANWRLEQNDAGKGKISADGDALLVEATEVTTEAWHVQATMGGLALTEGKEYTLSFQAKADKERQVAVTAMIDTDDWHAIGLSEQPDVTKEFKPFTFTFKAENVAKDSKNRVTFQVGQEKGKVWIKDLKLTTK